MRNFNSTTGKFEGKNPARLYTTFSILGRRDRLIMSKNHFSSFGKNDNLFFYSLGVDIDFLRGDTASRPRNFDWERTKWTKLI